MDASDRRTNRGDEMSNETTGPDWQSLTEATREAVETARAALDEFARAWNAATTANEKETK